MGGIAINSVCQYKVVQNRYYFIRFSISLFFLNKNLHIWQLDIWTLTILPLLKNSYFLYIHNISMFEEWTVNFRFEKVNKFFVLDSFIIDSILTNNYIWLDIKIRNNDITPYIWQYIYWQHLNLLFQTCQTAMMMNVLYKNWYACVYIYIYIYIYIIYIYIYIYIYC